MSYSTYASPNNYAAYKGTSYGASATLNTGITSPVTVSATVSTQANPSATAGKSYYQTNNNAPQINTAKSYLAQTTSPITTGSTYVSSTYTAYTPSPITVNSPYAAYLPKTDLTPHAADFVAPIKANENKKLFNYSMNKTNKGYNDPKTYEELSNHLDKTKTTFRDADFSAGMESLAGNNKRKQKTWAKYVWRSPDEFYGEGKYRVFTIAAQTGKEVDPVLAEKKEKQVLKTLENVDLKEYLPGYTFSEVKDLMQNIDASDIKQRALGDCYFLSTLAAITEYPHRVLRLFPHPDSTPFGCYMVKVCDMGEWKEIIVDDLFPCKTETSGPVFTIGNDKENWVLIIEKSLAKIYCSYSTIEAGFNREALHDHK
jgi:hypothetical protein